MKRGEGVEGRIGGEEWSEHGMRRGGGGKERGQKVRMWEEQWRQERT